MEKVAIIGCGAIAPTHINAILYNKNNIVGICDINKEKAEKLKKDFNLDCSIYTDYINMLNELEIDVLHICTPHFLHEKMIIEGLKRNINVLCEKPLCISLTGASNIKKQLDSSTAILGVCYQNRYNDSTIKAKEICQKYRFNKCNASLKWKREKEYYTQSNWRGKWSTEGGSLLINQSIHTIDLMCYLLGSPNEIDAEIDNISHKGIIETEDFAVLNFRSQDVLYNFSGTTSSDKDYPVVIELSNDDDKLIITPNNLIFNGKSTNYALEEFDFSKAVWGDGHKKLIKDFYDCISQSKPFSIGFNEALVSLKIVLASYSSKGNKIKI